MSDRWKEICPICGNYRQNGICLRCNANSASRARRWRRGDRGGVRPERRNLVSGRPGKKASKPTKKTVGTERKSKPRNLASSFYLALHGRWYSAQERLGLTINLLKGHWIFTTAKGRRLRQKWQLEHKTAESLYFEYGRRRIVATVNDDVRLVLTGRKGPVLFHFFKEGTKHRLCPSCYGKTEWSKKSCAHCDWRFR